MTVCNVGPLGLRISPRLSLSTTFASGRHRNELFGAKNVEVYSINIFS